MTQEIMDRIIVEEKIRSGKPLIKGMRVPVELIIGRLAGGMTFEELMSEYDLDKADILAVLAYWEELVVVLVTPPPPPSPSSPAYRAAALSAK